MKKISPRSHGYIDLVTIVIFAFAPTLLNLSNIPAMLSYGLAVAHFLVTLISGFPAAELRLIPFTVQGWIERIVGPALIIAPFALNFSDEISARNFFIGIGVVIIAVGLITDYQGQNRSYH